MDINEIELKYQEVVLKVLKGEEKLNNQDINLLFDLHNKVVNPSKRETGRRCGGCISRVVKKIKDTF